MAKQNRKGRNAKGQYVNLPFGMIASPAYKALPALAVALYVQVACRYNGDNNGKIPYSTREAAKALRIGKNTAAKLFMALVDKGFLKIAEDSSFNFKLAKARRWELTQ